MNKLSIRDTLVSVDDNKLVSSSGAGAGDGGDDEFNPFQRTGCLFGSLIKEIKYRYSYYISDITDALNLHCLIALIFTFTVCVAPALSFGGILADKTDKTFGINEMLLATSINGIIAGLFSGQPLMILGSTGPFLVFEEMLYNVSTVPVLNPRLCSQLKLDSFLPSHSFARRSSVSSSWRHAAGLPCGCYS